jgi:hypothetical protein
LVELLGDMPDINLIGAVATNGTIDRYSSSAEISRIPARTLPEATQKGEKITPPILPPFYAMARAAGRARTNQGEAIALIAAALIAPQPRR